MPPDPNAPPNAPPALRGPSFRLSVIRLAGMIRVWAALHEVQQREFGMITKRTVLVLGAGASAPYGYPTGRDLKDRVMDDLSDPGSPKVKELFGNSRDLAKAVSDFAKALEVSDADSVDAFLEDNKEDDEIGKRAIAQALGNCEKAKPLAGDWYAWLFNRMKDDCRFEQFGDNRLTVITFNYDRSWEQYLYTKFTAWHYQERHDATVDQLNLLPVIHVHGCLGRLRWQEGNDEPIDYGAYKSSGGRARRFVISKMARGIEIIHGAGETSDKLKLARQALREAKRVYFIGFGYGRNNVERLKLDDVTAPHQTISGSRFLIRDADLRRVKQLPKWVLQPILSQDKESDALEFISNMSDKID